MGAYYAALWFSDSLQTYLLGELDRALGVLVPLIERYPHDEDFAHRIKLLRKRVAAMKSEAELAPLVPVVGALMHEIAARAIVADTEQERQRLARQGRKGNAERSHKSQSTSWTLLVEEAMKPTAKAAKTRRGDAVREVAKQRKVTTRTVYRHLREEKCRKL